MDRDRQQTRPTNDNMRLTGTEQHEHDALAELFLGDAPLAPAPMGGTAHPTKSEARVPSGDPHAVTPGVPKNIGPKGESRVATFEGSAARSAAERAETGDAHADHLTVELVVLGHLPVRASLWVRQYACLAARKRSETVALVRTAGASVAVDVITGKQRAEIEPVDSIEDAMTIVRSAATRVVMRVDETTEPELLERSGLDEVTILTGADEAAVVASYRLIKSLVSTLDDRLEPDALPRLRVAVMGGAGDDIAQACQKIERACRAFLDRPIEVLDASGRIDATGTASVCRVDEPGSAERAFDALLGGVGFAEMADFEEERVPLLRLAEAEDEDISADEIESVTDEMERQSAPLPEVVVRPMAAAAFGAVASDVESKPTTAKSIARLREPLSSLIEGLTAIETRCPGAPGVEFACDREGQLHAVTTDEGADPVARLIAAAAWALDNLSLLIRAEPSVAMPTGEPGQDGGVALHLLARCPSQRRAMLETDVHVYALASATLRGEELMVATPLNV